MANQIPESPEDTQALKAKEALIDNARLEAAGDETVSWKYNPAYHDIADFLGLQQEDKMDERIAHKISFLRDYVDTKDSTEAKIKMLELQRRIGTTVKGKLLVNALYQYVKLSRDRDKIDKEISLVQAQYGQ